MHKKQLLTLALLATLTTTAGCAYRHFLGMHGPTIKNYPEIHLDSIKEDAQCLECHAPKNSAGDAPATSHPDFKGCLNCHNDSVKG